MGAKKKREKPITTDEFDNALTELVNEMTAEQLFTIPGVYELLAEDMNNEALALAKKNRERDGG